MCDIVPYVTCLDSQFIKISTFDLIYIFDSQQDDKKDMENQLALQGNIEKIRDETYMKTSELKEEMEIVNNEANVMMKSNVANESVKGDPTTPLKLMMVNHNNMESIEGYSDTHLFGSSDGPYEAMRINDPKLFQFDQAFERSWYNVNNKLSKSKLGKLYNARLKGHLKDKEK